MAWDVRPSRPAMSCCTRFRVIRWEWEGGSRCSRSAPAEVRVVTTSGGTSAFSILATGHSFASTAASLPQLCALNALCVLAEAAKTVILRG